MNKNKHFLSPISLQWSRNRYKKLSYLNTQGKFLFIPIYLENISSITYYHHWSLPLQRLRALNSFFQLLLIFAHEQWLVSNSQYNTEHPPQQQNEGYWLSLVRSPVSLYNNEVFLRRSNFNISQCYTATRQLTSSTQLV